VDLTPRTSLHCSEGRLASPAMRRILPIADAGVNAPIGPERAAPEALTVLQSQVVRYPVSGHVLRCGAGPSIAHPAGGER